jgi:hypothetical protein
MLEALVGHANILMHESPKLCGKGLSVTTLKSGKLLLNEP